MPTGFAAHARGRNHPVVRGRRNRKRTMRYAKERYRNRHLI